MPSSGQRAQRSHGGLPDRTREALEHPASQLDDEFLAVGAEGRHHVPLDQAPADPVGASGELDRAGFADPPGKGDPAGGVKGHPTLPGYALGKFPAGRPFGGALGDARGLPISGSPFWPHQRAGVLRASGVPCRGG